MSEPAGIRIADDEADTILEQRYWTVLHEGQHRTLDLWLARGCLRNAQKGVQEAREGAGGHHGMATTTRAVTGPGNAKQEGDSE